MLRVRAGRPELEIETDWAKGKADIYADGELVGHMKQYEDGGWGVYWTDKDFHRKYGGMGSLNGPAHLLKVFKKW